MNKIIRILSWVFAIMFVIVGLALLAKSVLAALFSILLAFLLFPKTKEFVQKKFGYMLPGKIKVGIIVILLIGIGIAMPKSDVPTPSTKKQEVSSEQPAPAADTQVPVQEVTQNTPPSVVKSDQEILEDGLKQIASNHKSNVSYKGVDVDGGAKMITASFNVLSFLNRDSLLHDTGRISTETFQAIFKSKLNPTDAVVWYYGETTDRYGNKKDDIVLSYAMDKLTYEKINWQNFDSKTLCDFLRQELQANPESGNACVERVKIQ